jgi:hypothetical protein
LSKNVYKKFYKERNVCVQVLFTNIYVISFINVTFGAVELWTLSNNLSARTTQKTSFVIVVYYRCRRHIIVYEAVSQ